MRVPQKKLLRLLLRIIKPKVASRVRHPRPGSIPPRATKIKGLQPESVSQNSITHSLHSFNLGIRCKTLHSMFISFAEQYAQKT